LICIVLVSVITLFTIVNNPVAAVWNRRVLASASIQACICRVRVSIVAVRSNCALSAALVFHTSISEGIRSTSAHRITVAKSISCAQLISAALGSRLAAVTIIIGVRKLACFRRNHVPVSAYITGRRPVEHDTNHVHPGASRLIYCINIILHAAAAAANVEIESVSALTGRESGIMISAMTLSIVPRSDCAAIICLSAKSRIKKVTAACAYYPESVSPGAAATGHHLARETQRFSKFANF
jgi:hypothetical protein